MKFKTEALDVWMVSKEDLVRLAIFICSSLIFAAIIAILIYFANPFLLQMVRLSLPQEGLLFLQGLLFVAIGGFFLAIEEIYASAPSIRGGTSFLFRTRKTIAPSIFRISLVAIFTGAILIILSFQV